MRPRTQQSMDQLVEHLLALGFDVTVPGEDSARPRCSQCAALVINGVPCHELTCPNAKFECAGCNTLVPRGVRYCADCR